jgi:hypothetical protein
MGIDDRHRQSSIALALLQFSENLLGDILESLENTGSLECHCFVDWLAFLQQIFLKRVDGHGAGQVAFVELKDIGDLHEVVAVLLEVVMKVLKGFDVGVHTLFLRVGYEHHSIHAAENQLAAGVVKHLSRDGIEVKPGLESANCSEIERKEVEKEGTVGFRGQRDHFALLLLAGFVVNHLQISGLAAEARAVIHDLAIDFSGGEIDKTQAQPLLGRSLAPWI